VTHTNVNCDSFDRLEEGQQLLLLGEVKVLRDPYMQFVTHIYVVCTRI